MDIAAGLFIVACWVSLYGFLAIAAFRTKRTVEGRDWWLRIWWWRIGLLLFVVGIVTFIPHLGAHTLDALVPHKPVAQEIVADLVTLLGFAVAFWARIMLGGNWSIGVTFKEDHELIQRGPYRYVRHPMYSGLSLLILGLVIWFADIVGLAIALVIFAGLWRRSRQEEKLLTVHFSTAYPEYRKRTKALIPFVL